MLLAQVVFLAALVSSSVVTLDLKRVKNLQMQLEEGATVDDLFHQFKITFDKVYPTVREEMSRREIFESNLAVIKKHNEQYRREDSTYAMGINKFTDMTDDELSTGCSKKLDQNFPVGKPSHFRTVRSVSVDDLPREVDWRKEGFVRPPLSQGACGSCWALASIGAIEGQLYKNTGESIDLSKQQLVSCDPRSDKCEGGDSIYAYKYVMTNGGLQSERDYPYIAENGTCRDERGENVPGTAIECYKKLPEGNERYLQYTVATRGPVVVSINVQSRNFRNYETGIYYEPNCSSEIDDLNHCGLVVGYGNDPKPYWLVKNSWGTGWGDKGYIKILKDKNNHCGIATEATIPTLKGNKKWNRNKRAIDPNNDDFTCDGQNTSARHTTATYTASVISILAVFYVLL